MQPDLQYPHLPAGIEEPYTVVGVDRNSSDKTLRRAYKVKALALHPDKNPDDAQAGTKFDLLTKAFEFLSDAPQRAAYDSWVDRQEQKRKLFEKYDVEKKKFASALHKKECEASDNFNKGGGWAGTSNEATSQAQRAKKHAGTRSAEESEEVKRIRRENEKRVFELQEQQMSKLRAAKERRQEEDRRKIAIAARSVEVIWDSKISIVGHQDSSPSNLSLEETSQLRIGELKVLISCLAQCAVEGVELSVWLADTRRCTFTLQSQECALKAVLNFTRIAKRRDDNMEVELPLHLRWVEPHIKLKRAKANVDIDARKKTTLQGNTAPTMERDVYKGGRDSWRGSFHNDPVFSNKDIWGSQAPPSTTPPPPFVSAHNTTRMGTDPCSESPASQPQTFEERILKEMKELGEKRRAAQPTS